MYKTLCLRCLEVSKMLDRKWFGNYSKTGKELKHTRWSLAARRKQLVCSGKGNKPNAYMALEVFKEEKLFNSGAFGVHDSDAVQQTI